MSKPQPAFAAINTALPSPRLLLAVEVLLVLIGASALSTESACRRWIALLTTVAVLCLPRLWRERQRLYAAVDAVPLAALGLWPLCLGVLALWHGDGLDVTTDNSWLFLAAIGIALLLRWVRPNPAVVMAALAIGAAAAGGIALLEVELGGIPRAAGHWHFIVFGNLSLLLGILPLFALRSPWLGRGYRELVLIGALGGMAASVLSGSRGGWVALPLVVLVAVLTQCKPMWGNDRRLAWLLVAGGLLSAMAVAPTVVGRFAQAQQDLQDYSRGQVETSMGMRLVMWRVALDMLPAVPLQGVGRAGFHEKLVELAKQGKIIPRMTEFRHTHNELLDAYVSGGAIKLLALLLLYAMPLVYFLRKYRYAGEFQVFALAGALTIGCMMIFGLSEVMFSHTVTNRVYPLLLAVCVGMLPARPKGGAHV